jgi:NADH:ubiquinone oxidoreductase subunit
MKTFFTQFFTWWNGQNLNTRFFTWRNGKRVGTDGFGNVYYQGGKDYDGTPKRWVIYNGYSDGSTVPPGWHGWLHRRVDTPPSEEQYVAHDWEIAHEPNYTGTAKAYRPDGSVLSGKERPRVTGDYDAWTPGS